MGTEGQDRHQELVAGEEAVIGDDPGHGVRQRHRRDRDWDLDPENWDAAPADGDEWLFRERPPHW